MIEKLILIIYKDKPSQLSPYLLDTMKVAELEVTDMPIDELKKILEIQDMLGRRWETRRTSHANKSV